MTSRVSGTCEEDTGVPDFMKLLKIPFREMLSKLWENTGKIEIMYLNFYGLKLSVVFYIKFAAAFYGVSSLFIGKC